MPPEVHACNRKQQEQALQTLNSTYNPQTGRPTPLNAHTDPQPGLYTSNKDMQAVIPLGNIYINGNTHIRPLSGQVHLNLLVTQHASKIRTDYYPIDDPQQESNTNKVKTSRFELPEPCRNLAGTSDTTTFLRFLHRNGLLIFPVA